MVFFQAIQIHLALFNSCNYRIQRILSRSSCFLWATSRKGHLGFSLYL